MDTLHGVRRMLNISPPLPYSPEQPFIYWLDELENYILAAAGVIDEPRKKAILLSIIGPTAKKVIANFSPTEKSSYTSIVDALKGHYTEHQNDVVERHVFNTLAQHEGETIDTFVTRLRTQAAKCNYKVQSVTRTLTVNEVEHPVNVEFTDLTDDLIRDRIVVGIHDKATRARLLREKNLTLETAIGLVRSQEIADEQIRQLTPSMPSVPQVVDAVKRKKKKYKKPQIDSPGSESSEFSDRPTHEKKEQSKMKCRFCGKIHKRGECSAYGKRCSYCGGQNHFEVVCYAKKRNQKQKNRKVNAVKSPTDSSTASDQDASLFIGAIELEVRNVCELREWTECVQINNCPVVCKIDTGAECNVISESVLNSITHDPILPSTTVLRAYGGKKLPTVGKLKLNCKLNGLEFNAYFHVVKLKVKTILGLDSCSKLKLVNPGCAHKPQQLTPDHIDTHVYTHHNDTDKVINPVLHDDTLEKFIDSFKDVFDEKTVGCMKNWNCSIKLKSHCEPVVNPVRRIPFTIKDRVINELKRMEKLKIIKQVDEPTEWVNSMVIVNKPDNQLRICLDPTQLNKFVMREHIQIPTADEIFAQISEASVFSKLDLKNGYWQLPLTKESSYLTTFNTPIGRFRYLRMPFGLNSANEIFQKKMTQIFAGLAGVIVIFDDILIVAKDAKEHYEYLEKCLERCREVGIRLNLPKCEFFTKSVKYIGHIIGKDGITADPDKIKDIIEMPKPTDRKSLQRLLGMVTYLGRYIPNLSHITEPLRQLLHKNSKFVWSFEQEKCLQNIKEILISNKVLAYYDVDADVELHADASKDGLGACLIQKNRPVAYASRSLTVTEKNYAQIEKELLSVVFAVERFHQYIYAKHVNVYTDHKPLIPLMKRPIHEAPARIQRLLLRLLRYDITLIFKPGKEHIIPDTLSRACANRE